jgi:hypothetical protein
MSDKDKNNPCKVSESCRVELTPEELIAAGRELAAAQTEVRQLEDDFKGVRDEWKARISAVEARITACANRIGRGYDLRPVECLVVFDEPKAGMKSCFRSDTSERVWVRDMTDADRQLIIDFNDSSDEPAMPAELIEQIDEVLEGKKEDF